MTAFNITVPYLRSSPLHVPRRDLVLSAADSLEMTITVVESDDPAATPIELSGGIGGPTVTLFIWPWGCYRRSWDYGAPMTTPGAALWNATGTISNADAGQFSIFFPINTMAGWPRRAEWSLQLDWNHGTQSEQLICGYLNVNWSGNRLMAPTVITTDSGTAISADDGTLLGA